MFRLLCTVAFVVLLAGGDPPVPPPGPKPPGPKPPPVPESLSGQEVVGKRLPLEQLVWVHPTSSSARDLEGHVTLVRWWTETCPYCERSLPVIQKLHDKYESRGFRTLAVYHPKPPRDVDHGDIFDWARAREFKEALALDPDWRTLKDFYLSTRRATSVSFILDRAGVVRYVHPGPVLAPGKKGYDDVEQAIEALLAERPQEGDGDAVDGRKSTGRAPRGE